MAIYRTMKALTSNESFEDQLLEMVLTAHLFDGKALDFDTVVALTDPDVREDSYRAAYALLGGPWVYEGARGTLALVPSAVQAVMDRVGLYTDPDQVPPGVEVFSLTPRGEALLEDAEGVAAVAAMIDSQMPPNAVN